MKNIQRLNLYYNKQLAKEQIDLIKKYPILLENLTTDDLILTRESSLNKLAITYKQLYRNTPKEIKKRKVTTRPLVIKVWKRKNGKRWLRYWFSFKGSPSTTGRRSKGYIKFLEPEDVVKKKGEKNVDVAVWCSCPYFTYNLEWVLTFTVVPKASEIKNSNGMPPQVRNTELLPHLCKHLVALKDYLD